MTARSATTLFSPTTLSSPGHVHVGDWVILGGFTGVHQFVWLGAHSMTAVGTVLLRDLPPYVMAAGSLAEPRGINSEGLKRRGFSPESVMAIRRALQDALQVRTQTRRGARHPRRRSPQRLPN